MSRISSAALVLLGFSGLAIPARAESVLTYANAAPSPATGHIFLSVAEAAGFFKQENLKVDIRFTSGGPVAAQMVGSDNADLGEITFEPAAAAYIKGVRGKYIFSSWSNLIYKIGVLPDGPIKTVADLKDKRIGAPTIASAAIPIAKSILKNAGVPVSDANFVPIGIGASALTALKSQQVDAYAGFNTAFAVLARSGVELRYFEHPTAAHVGNGGFFASETAIKNKSKELSGFVRSIAKAYVFTSVNPQAAMKMLWKKFPQLRGSGTDEEALKGAMAELKVALTSYNLDPKSGRFGTFDVKAIDGYLGVIRKEGLISEEVPSNVLLSDQFIAAANDFDREAVRKRAREWRGL